MVKEIFTHRVPVARSDTVHVSGISSDNSITPHMTVSAKHTDLQHFVKQTTSHHVQLSAKHAAKQNATSQHATSQHAISQHVKLIAVMHDTLVISCKDVFNPLPNASACAQSADPIA